MAHSSLFWSLLLGIQNDEGVPSPQHLGIFSGMFGHYAAQIQTVFPLEVKYDCLFPSIRPTDGY